jgi:2-polyprenyl-3-methyl-5-hydroxy-6-metoxy-1,4-benzoquinol methylase
MKNQDNRNIKEKQPWPTKAAMEQVYEMNLWGGKGSEFYSGEGSHHAELVNPYIVVLKTFLAPFHPQLTVCDLGCGDFNVGKELVKSAKKYVAADIVSDLIEFNKEKFNEDNLEFHCLDIAVDDLPEGDVVILRQVLQHLSNGEIQNILSKLIKYKYIILTEHIPLGDFTPNKDILSGQGIRLKKRSGVDIMEPPFNFKVKEEKELLSIILNNGNGVVVTTLYVNF